MAKTTITNEWTLIRPPATLRLSAENVETEGWAGMPYLEYLEDFGSEISPLPNDSCSRYYSQNDPLAIYVDGMWVRCPSHVSQIVIEIREGA